MSDSIYSQSDDLYFTDVEAFGRTFRFLNNSRIDHIQNVLNSGKFYEQEELELIVHHAPNARQLLDVGSNVGTHTIYLAHRLNLQRAVPIEPQPAILNILKANLGLNWHPSFDLSHLGIALGSGPSTARISKFSPQNLGGTQLQIVENDSNIIIRDKIYVDSGDNRFSAKEFDLIKIDAEGMEEAVIKGLSNTLLEFEGLLFVEVYDSNAVDFGNYVSSTGWKKIDEYRRYEQCTNWFLRRS
jgi:FkbM family methyltransferase